MRYRSAVLDPGRAALYFRGPFLAPFVAFMALLVACSDNDRAIVPAPVGRLQCVGPTSTVFPSERGTIVATLTDGAGKPLAGRTLRWKSSGGPGALLGPRDQPVDQVTTDASGKATVQYAVAFDADFQGEIIVTADTADAGPMAHCEVRFKANSPGLPPPPTPTR